MRYGLPLLLLIPAHAQAKWPDDVRLSSMTEYAGEAQVDLVKLSEDYNTVVTELGAAIANQAFAPARTLGMKGFAFEMTSGFAFNSTRTTVEGEPPPWARVHEEGIPTPLLITPGLSVRKGLPLSLETGFNMNWIGFSRTGVFGGYGRLAILEGFKPAPDITMQWGYSGYVGNNELDVGVVDLSFSMGTTLPFGALPDFNQSWFSPYISYTTLRVKVQPNLDEETTLAIGAVPYTQKNAIILPRVSGGFDLTAGTFTIGAQGSWTPGALAAARLKLGWTY